MPLPRLGVLLTLPAHLDRLTLFGRGPGEAYADTREATRVGRFDRGVDVLQTPTCPTGERPPDRRRRIDAEVWARGNEIAVRRRGWRCFGV
ncbi:hypothetical protein [Phytoactinopolyspora endophytica]|uniref:hypothetical protein n=1 Tax=Phytoactinopolyspora endophytica TaxID=1642495 RepID=UPI00197C939E